MSDSKTDKIPHHGVPDGATDDEPKGLPTSDRHHSETAPADAGGNADASKHQHMPE